MRCDARYFVALLFIVGFVSVRCEQEVEKRNDAPDWAVPLKEFESIVKNGEAIVVDVREPDEVYDVRVDAKKYINVPLKQVESSLEMSNEAFEEKYKAPKPSKEDDVIFLCRSGRRSETALKGARKLNYMKTRHFLGGTLGWIENFPDIIIRQKELDLAAAKEEL